MKLGSKAIAIVLLFVGLVLVNYLASSVPVRIDATAESIYSLSAGTKKMLGKIEEPVAIDLYFSKDASGLPIAYKNYAARVQEMLRQYVRESYRSGNLLCALAAGTTSILAPSCTARKASCGCQASLQTRIAIRVSAASNARSAGPGVKYFRSSKLL